MNAAIPKARSTPTPPVKKWPGSTVSVDTPSGALTRASTETTVTTRNSRATRTPRTLADRSTLFTPSAATTAHPTRPAAHQGTDTPVNVVTRAAREKPNSPYRPTCIML